ILRGPGKGEGVDLSVQSSARIGRDIPLDCDRPAKRSASAVEGAGFNVEVSVYRRIASKGDAARVVRGEIPVDLHAHRLRARSVIFDRAAAAERVAEVTQWKSGAAAQPERAAILNG